MLEEIFKLYVLSNNYNKVKKHYKINASVTNAKFGDVVEILSNDTILIAVYIDDSQALLMSEYWELARHKDLIVSFKHALSNKWIIQLDKRLYNVKSYSIAGNLSENDIEILKLTLLDHKPLPLDKTGPKIPPNPEDIRMKFSEEEMKKVILYNDFL